MHGLLEPCLNLTQNTQPRLYKFEVTLIKCYCWQEIEAVVPDATKKDIGKAYKTIMACLQADEGVRCHVSQSLCCIIISWSILGTCSSCPQPVTHAYSACTKHNQINLTDQHPVSM